MLLNGKTRAMNFWETKKLSEMTTEEWESVCDGCGKCCLNKLEDEDSGEIFFTSVVCDLIDLETCQCTSYSERTTLVHQRWVVLMLGILLLIWRMITH